MATLLLFILGLSIGSFLNVLIDRIPRSKNIWRGRSVCDHCGHRLSFLDLIPIISFLILKGRCRYCGKKISYYYPIIEFTTGALFAAAFMLVANNIQYQISDIQFLTVLLFNLFLASVFVVVFFTDLKYGVIPDKTVFPALLISGLYVLVFNQTDLLNHFLSAAGAFIFFLAIIIATKGRGMGMGDAKFAAFIGMALGFPLTVVGIYIAFLTGAISGLILILWRRKSLKESIPFGPFLSAGSLFAFFLKDYLLLVLPLLKAL